MKKILIITLCLIISFTLCSSVLAQDTNPNRVRNQERVAPTVVEDAPVPELYDSPVTATGAQKSQAKGQAKAKSKGEQRRSQVASAVHELLAVADRQGGIGEQVRLIAQNQEKHQEQIETALKEAKKRSRWLKFIIGPKYQQLERVKSELKAQTSELGVLQGLLGEISGTADEEAAADQLNALMQVKAEVASELNKEMQGVSLFGWLNKLLSGYKN